jgi:chemotaxis protein histidine kinase CheA
MSVDAFADRLARVRQRFVSTLECKIGDTYKAIPDLSDTANPGAAATAVDQTYRCMHGLVGIGPTVGFPATGRAAHDAEDVLRAPQHERRGLSADELLAFKKSLQVLREAASRELKFLYSV